MANILVAVAVFTAVFVADYLFYMKQKTTYEYASIRTYLLFILGQIALVSLFYEKLIPYFKHFKIEAVFLGVLLLVLLTFTYILMQNRLLVCNIISRTERCLTPAYIMVKGAEIVFQQVTYLVIALSLVEIMDYTVLTFIAFIQILLIMHTPVIISSSKTVISRLAFGIGVIGAPILYIFISVGYFFPAVYLHGIIYVFYWVVFADFEDNHIADVKNSG